ncbi:prolyl-tRNA synthetase [Candidatus Kaiserbacteria bacterium]|nr:prolyl-tRNA synthetase [Candidatus Kaiserbacteria bacterium]
MRQSELFTKTRREAPKDEVAKNAQLLIRAGYIHKEMAGVYSMLPLGLRVLNKIVQVIREEMNAIGGQEMLMSALQDKEIWSRTDRWDLDVWFKTNLASGGETGLGITHEEPLTRIMSEHISSYRDLPIAAYQFQTKFRNELRAKSGIMRGKEFLMKDMYSFSRDEREHKKMYGAIRGAYIRAFDRLGIGNRTYVTFADGGIFSDFSEEFQTVSDAGEDTIYVHEEKKIAVNKEVYTEENLKKIGVSKDEFVEKKAIEVGNIFHLGTRFSEALGLTYKDEKSVERSVVMGCYGIGPSRIMGTIVEVLADTKGIVWPREVAPFHVHLLSISGGNGDVTAEANRLYELLKENGIEVLYDDRDARAGEKFADSELIGIPKRIIVSEKTMAEGGVEVVSRVDGSAFVSENDLIEHSLA